MGYIISIDLYRGASMKYFDLYFFKTLFNRFFDDEIGLTAAALSYYMVFSFFPLLIMLSIVLGRLGIQSGAGETLLLTILPDDIVQIAHRYLVFVNSEGSSNILFASAFFTVYFPVRSVTKLMDGINRAYDREGQSTAVRRFASVLIFGLIVYGLIIFGIFLISVGESAITIILRFLGLPVQWAQIWTYAKFIILWSLGSCVVLALHYVSPGEKMKISDMLPGCVISVTVWTVVSMFFSMYVKYIGRYSLLYGSIGAVMILLYWFYITAVILLMGAEFSSILRERKRKFEK